MNLINPETKLPFDALQISDAELGEAMGYGTATPDESVSAEMHALLRRVASITVPRFEFVIEEGTLCLEDDTLHIGGRTLHVGRIIARQLRGAEQYALFTASAGMEFENLQHALEDEGDMVKCYLADCMGSIIAEKTADCMEIALQHAIDPQGWRHTNRFSPGYCGWHVREQPDLFSLFPTPHPCGIHLTDSCLMVPIKSVSGVIGIGPNVKKLEYSCGLCDYKNCYKRRKPAAKTA